MPAALRACSAACVLPELVGPMCATILRRIMRAAGYHEAGAVRSVRYSVLLTLLWWLDSSSVSGRGAAPAQPHVTSCTGYHTHAGVCLGVSMISFATQV